MTEAAPAEKEEKEADHHPYFRPKDAATLILIDRSGEKPKVLVGKRHDNVVFMPGKYELHRLRDRRPDMYGVIGKTGARCPDLAAMAVAAEQEA